MTNLQKFVKIVIKVLDPEKDCVHWVHLCYVSRDLYNRFMYEKAIKSTDLNEVISRWCNEDFLTDIQMTSVEDILLLKSLVKDFYKRAHPDLFLDSKTDRQGWLRLWVTRKIKEELKIYGEECK